MSMRFAQLLGNYFLPHLLFAAVALATPPQAAPVAQPCNLQAIEDVLRGLGNDLSHLTIDDLATFQYPKKWSATLQSSTKFEPGEYLRLLTERPELFLIEDVSKDKKYIAVIDPLGERFYFEREIHHPFVTLKRVDLKQTKFSDVTKQWTKIRPIERSFSIKGKNLKELSEFLTQSQLEASLTAMSPGNDLDKIYKSVMAANQNMLMRLQNSESLTVASLNTVNELIAEGGAKESLGVAGLVRGTKGTKVIGGKKYRYDLTGIVTSIGAPDPMAHFTTAEKVPAKFEELIADVNNLNRKSTIRDVAEIYRRFIFLHPYTDGNGRTAKILTDYCLIKIGFPPLAHDYEFTRDAVYRSLPELEWQFREAIMD